MAVTRASASRTPCRQKHPPPCGSRGGPRRCGSWCRRDLGQAATGPRPLTCTARMACKAIPSACRVGGSGGCGASGGSGTWRSGEERRIAAPTANGTAVWRRRSPLTWDDHPTATAVAAAKVYGTAVSSTAAGGPWPEPRLPRRSSIAIGVQNMSAYAAHDLSAYTADSRHRAGERTAKRSPAMSSAVDGGLHGRGRRSRSTTGDTDTLRAAPETASAPSCRAVLPCGRIYAAVM